MPRTPTATAYTYVDCPACRRGVMEPFAIQAGPVPFVHDNSDCGQRLLVWPGPGGENNCVWRVPRNMSLESALVSSREQWTEDPRAPWRWSIVDAREAA